MPCAPNYYGMTREAFTRWKNEARKVAKERRIDRKVTTRYFQRIKNDDCICEFVLIKPTDPNQRVFSVLNDPKDPTGVNTIEGQTWQSHWEGPDVLVFRAADDYTGGPIGWIHSPDQVVEAMSPEEQKKFFFSLGAAS